MVLFWAKVIFKNKACIRLFFKIQNTKQTLMPMKGKNCFKGEVSSSVSLYVNIYIFIDWPTCNYCHIQDVHMFLIISAFFLSPTGNLCSLSVDVYCWLTLDGNFFTTYGSQVQTRWEGKVLFPNTLYKNNSFYLHTSIYPCSLFHI